MAVAIDQLLGCVLSTGYTSKHTRSFAIKPALLSTTTTSRRTVLQQLMRLGGMTEQRAVAVLARNPEMLGFKPENLSTRFENMQQLTGTNAAQAARVIGESCTAFRYNNSRTAALMEALTGEPPTEVLIFSVGFQHTTPSEDLCRSCQTENDCELCSMILGNFLTPYFAKDEEVSVCLPVTRGFT